ncbi:MAG: TetR/AcrR family transcriptional regulator [Chloroflexi bacterium]|nr:TetR/AcrR family transcriptional regulator [Chloroflexota bacterium]
MPTTGVAIHTKLTGQLCLPRTSTARERLIDSACHLVHAGSYAATSVDDLCAAAGVQKGSFYHFFSAKHELVIAAVDRQWARAWAEVLEPAFAHDVPAPRRFARFFRLVAEHQYGELVRGCPFGNLAAEVGTLELAVRERVASVFDGYLSYFELALQDAADAGLLEATEVKSTAATVLACFQGALLLAKTRNDPRLIEQVGERVVRLLAVDPVSPSAISRPASPSRRPVL